MNLCVLELASDGLKGRVFEVSLADLQDDEQAFRKFRLIAEEIAGKNVLTNFHGMTMTTDKLRSLVKKWQVCVCVYTCVYIFISFMLLRLHLQTMIEANVDVKTTDGYLLRVFCIGFTKRQPNQIKKTSYAKSSQCRTIRKRMVEIMNREISQIDLKEAVNKL